MKKMIYNTVYLSVNEMLSIIGKALEIKEENLEKWVNEKQSSLKILSRCIYNYTFVVDKLVKRVDKSIKNELEVGKIWVVIKNNRERVVIRTFVLYNSAKEFYEGKMKSLKDNEICLMFLDGELVSPEDLYELSITYKYIGTDKCFIPFETCVSNSYKTKEEVESWLVRYYKLLKNVEDETVNIVYYRGKELPYIYSIEKDNILWL